MNKHSGNQDNHDERGQVTIVMLGVIAVAMVLAVAIALIGQAMVHRARARTAADAIVLASIVGPGAEQQLTQWYTTQGVVTERRRDGIWAGSGPSQAAAWAATTTDEVQTEPVLRAIVARIEQLRGHRFETITWGRFFFEVNEIDAPIMQSMSDEFLLCAASSTEESADSRTTRYRFERC